MRSQINDTTALMKSERNENDYVQRQFQWEDDHMGNFRRIYPCFDKDKYQPFFTQNALSVFQDTVASRAREEASRIEREENEVNFSSIHDLTFWNWRILNQFFILMFRSNYCRQNSHTKQNAIFFTNIIKWCHLSDWYQFFSAQNC